jgi:hypothetical protein
MPTVEETAALLAGATDRVDDALAAAQGSNAERDTPPLAEPKPVHKESVGAGRSLEAENRAARLSTLSTRLAAAEKAGNADMVAKIKEQMAELE